MLKSDFVRCNSDVVIERLACYGSSYSVVLRSRLGQRIISGICYREITEPKSKSTTRMAEVLEFACPNDIDYLSQKLDLPKIQAPTCR